MITPSYGLTATERVLPRMALDFTTASLDTRVTFTRTGDTATVINSSGVIATALANVPRFDYDPSTLICKGLLIEEARTNLLIRSIPDLAVPTGYTVVVGSGTYTHTLQSGFGVLTGFQQVVKNEQTVSGRSALNIVTTLSASTTYTLSIYLDKTNSSITSGNATILQVASYSDVTGTVSATLANADANGRIAITFTTGADVIGNIRFGIGCAGDAVGVVYMAGWQLEVGAFPTSYIPTTSAALTRNADVATMTGTNFSDWYNATQGTFRVDASTPASGTRSLISADDDTSGDNIVMSTVGTAPKLVVTQSSAEQANVSAGTITANTLMFAYSSYAPNYFGIARPSARQVDTSGTVPTVDQLRIGTDQAGNYANGIIQAVQFWP